MTWKDEIKKADEYKSMLKLLREARDSGREAEKGLNYRWKMLVSGPIDRPNDPLSTSEIEQRINVIDKAITDIQKIIDDLEGGD